MYETWLNVCVCVCVCIMLHLVYSILRVWVIYRFIKAVDKYNGTRVSTDIIISLPHCVYWPSGSLKKHIHSWCSNAVSEHFSWLWVHTFCVSVMGLRVALLCFAEDTFQMSLCLVLVSCVFLLLCFKCLFVDVKVGTLQLTVSRML